MSVFSINYWIAKGFTEEEAKYQIAIRRPNNILYYINKGFTEEEAIDKVSERQAKGGIKRKNMTDYEKRTLSPRCIEFWLAKGLTTNEAKEFLSQHQKNFSKDICIAKYGKEKGLEIWQDRQDRWQKTLKNKSPEEIKDINIRKNRWKGLTAEEAAVLKKTMATTLLNTLSNRTVEESRQIGKKIRLGQVTTGRAVPESQIDAFILYKSQVWAETKRNDLTLLENYHKRGQKNYHLDHKYSIWQGFVDNTDPAIVGHTKNLEMLPYQENLSKFNKCSISLTELTNLIAKGSDV